MWCGRPPNPDSSQSQHFRDAFFHRRYHPRGRWASPKGVPIDVLPRRIPRHLLIASLEDLWQTPMWLGPAMIQDASDGCASVTISTGTNRRWMLSISSQHSLHWWSEAGTLAGRSSPRNLRHLPQRSYCSPPCKHGYPTSTNGWDRPTDHRVPPSRYFYMCYNKHSAPCRRHSPTQCGPSRSNPFGCSSAHTHLYGWMRGSQSTPLVVNRRTL
ncbi:uncharacterized protein BDZ99DRAFT_575484, partial [Mytilinidion resinicola]